MGNDSGTRSSPKLIFGAGNLGVSFPTPAETIELLDFLKSQDIRHIDTARRYPGPKPGLSEILLGESKAVESGFIVDTKINIPATGPSGSLTREKILESIDESCASLKVKQVNLNTFVLIKESADLIRSTPYTAIRQIWIRQPKSLQLRSLKLLRMADSRRWVELSA